MDAGLLSILSMVAYALAAVFLIITVFIFIFFRIPSVMRDLSSKRAHRSVSKTVKQNEKKSKAKAKSEKPKAEKQKRAGKNDIPETGLLIDNKAKNDDDEDTSILNKNEIEDDEGTTVSLVDDVSASYARNGGVKLTTLDEVILVNTEEVLF